jgi:hypothetical protein
MSGLREEFTNTHIFSFLKIILFHQRLLYKKKPQNYVPLQITAIAVFYLWKNTRTFRYVEQYQCLLFDDP